MSTVPVECSKIGNYSVDSNKEEVVHLTEVQQRELLFSKQVECLQRIRDDPRVLQGTFCQRTWDNVMCWGDIPADTVVCQQCPGYINNFKTNQFASRVCLPNGTWGGKPDLNLTNRFGWTNFSACLSPDTELELGDPAEDVPSVIVDNIKQMRIMYNIGYGLSLISLILAFTIMIYFRKLHCSRNTIHLHLFASFILRASVSLIRDNFMVGGMEYGEDVAYNGTTGHMFFLDGPHWGCRLFSTISNYSIACSYTWIFIEAVFLHMLIHVNVLSDRVKVLWYVVIGWSTPLVVVITWAVARATLDNYLCWNTHTRLPGLVWIIQAPIILTVVINFLFFISITRTLYTKLHAVNGLGQKRQRYRRMAKSILLLIPVFGVYYIVFTIPVYRFNETAAFVMLFIEMFCNSYEGFFISLVLCFINTEVRTEIRRAWSKTRLRRGSFKSNMSKSNSNYIQADTLEPFTDGTTHPKPKKRPNFLCCRSSLASPKVADRNGNCRMVEAEMTPFMVPEIADGSANDIRLGVCSLDTYNSNANNDKWSLNESCVEQAGNVNINGRFTTEIYNERVNTSGIYNEQANASEIYNERTNSSETCNERVNTSETCNERVHTSETCNERVHTSETCNERENTSDSSYERANTSEICNEQANTSYTCNELANTPETCNERANTLGTCTERANTSETCNQIVNTSGICNERGNTTENCNERANTSETCDERTIGLCTKSRDLNKTERCINEQHNQSGYHPSVDVTVSQIDDAAQKSPPSQYQNV